VILRSKSQRVRRVFRSPVGVAVVGLLLVVGAGLCGRWIYSQQKQRNTKALLAEAQQAESASEWNQASVAYRRYLRRQPTDEAALRAYARVLFERLKTTPEVLGDTVAVLQRLVGLDPQDTDALNKLTHLWLLLREYRSAEELAGHWLQQAPGTPAAILALARAQVGAGKTQEAVATLTAAAEQAPDVVLFYPLLVEILGTEMKRPDEAGYWLEQGLRLAADDPAIRVAAFLHWQGRGNRAEAEVHLRRALEVAPESLVTILTAAQFYLSESRRAEAKGLVERARNIAPDDRRVLSLWAACVKGEGDNAVLINAAEELRSHAGADAELLLQAAELFQQAHRLDEAGQCLLKLDAIPDLASPVKAKVDTLQGLQELRAGRSLAAVGWLLRALERNPSETPAMKALVRAYLLVGDLDAANEACRQLVAASPGDSAVRLVLADLAWRQRRFVEAKTAATDLPEPDGARQTLVRIIELAAELAEARRGNPSAGQRDITGPHLEAARALALQDATAALWLMRLFIVAGKPNEAVDLWRANLSGQETSEALGAELARLLLGHQHTDDALMLANEMIVRDHLLAEGHRLRVAALAALDRTAEAQRHIQMASLPPETKALLHESLADSHVSAGRVEPALVLYRQAADDVPGNVTTRQKIIRFTTNPAEAALRAAELRGLEGDTGFYWKFELAGSLLRLDSSGEDPQKALTLLQECLARRPRWSAARLLLGRAYERRGQYYDAAEAYRTALAHQPALWTSPTAVRLAELLMRLGRLHEAQTILGNLLAALPQEPAVLRLWMEQQIRKRDYDSARATAEELLQLQPDNPVWPALHADLLMRLGRLSEAEATVRTALQRHPNAMPLLVSLARALIAQGRPSEAEELAESAAQQAEDGPHYLFLSSVLASQGRKAEAEAAVSRAQALAPGDANVWAACADFWGRHGNWDRQLEAARRVVETRGESAEDSLLLAGILVGGRSDGEKREAREIIQRRLTRNPEDSQALVLAARLAATDTSPNLAEAESLSERALSGDSLLVEARCLLSSVQLARGRPEAARGTLRVGLAITPDDPELLRASAQLHLSVREFAEAGETALHLLEIRPRSVVGMQSLAVAYEQSGQASKALSFLQEQVSEDLASPEELMILAGLNESVSQHDRAEALLRRACALNAAGSDAHTAMIRFLARRRDFLQLRTLAKTRHQENPNNFEILLAAAEMLSSACSEPAQREEGERWFDNVAMEKPELAADAMYRSARCYYQCGELGSAEARFREALQRNPKHPLATNDLAWLYAADLARPEEALSLIDAFIANGGKEDGHLLDTRGLALLALGKLEAAERCFTACLRLTDSPRTRTSATYHLALVQLAAGRQGEAHSLLRQASNLDSVFGGLTPRQRDKCRELLAAGPSRVGSVQVTP